MFTGDVGEIHCLGVDALPRPLTCFAASRFTGDIREIHRRYSTLDLLRAIGLGLGGRGGPAEACGRSTLTLTATHK